MQQALFCQKGLLCLGGSHRADIGAVAALDAGVGVDDEDAVTLGDGFHGALTVPQAMHSSVILYAILITSLQIFNSLYHTPTKMQWAVLGRNCE